MKVNYIINSLQLYSMLFLVRISGLLLISSEQGYNMDIRYGLLHRVILYLLLFLLAAPMFLMKDKNKFGKIRNGIYLLAFMLCLIKIYTMFITFYRYSDSGGAWYIWILLFMGVVSVLAGVKGLEGISRSSLLLCVPIIAVLIFLVLGMFGQMDILNFEPQLFDMRAITSDLTASLGDMFSLAVLPFVAVHIDRISYKGFALWNTLSFLFEAAVLLCTCGVLGNLTGVMLFPVYNAAVSAEVGILRRLDFIVMAVVTICCFVCASMLIFLSGTCIKNIYGLKSHKKASVFCGIFAVILCVVLSMFDRVREVFLNRNLWIWIVLICVVALPIFYRKIAVKKGIKKTFVFLVAMIVALPTLSGCSYVNELDKRLIIKGVGIDNKDGLYDITMLVLNTDEMGQESSIVPVLSSGKTIEAAIENSKRKTGKQPYLGQNLFVLCGESCERENIVEISKAFSSIYDSRLSVNVFFCEGDAKKLLTKKEVINPEQLLLLAQTAEKTDSASVKMMNLMSAVQDMKNDIILPKLRKSNEGENAELYGAVIFSSDGKINTLDNDELLGYKLITNNKVNLKILANNKTVQIKKSNTYLTFENDGKSKFKINIKISLNTTASKEDMKFMEICCEKAVNKCMKNKTDCLDIERYMYLYRYALYTSIENPKKAIYNADYSISVEYM